MPRAENHPAAVVTGLREFLIGKARAQVARLADAKCDWYSFAADLQRQRDRMNALVDGDDVLVYRHEIPAEWQLPRDGTIVYTVTVDRLVPYRSH